MDNGLNNGTYDWFKLEIFAKFCQNFVLKDQEYKNIKVFYIQLINFTIKINNYSILYETLWLCRS